MKTALKIFIFDDALHTTNTEKKKKKEILFCTYYFVIYVLTKMFEN